MSSVPGYIKYFAVLSSVVLTVYILILGKSILSPIMTAFILALLLRPLSSRMERFKIPRGFSSILSIVAIFIVLFGLSYFFSSQVGNISRDMDSLGERMNEIIDRGHSMMEDNFGIKQQQQSQYLKNSLNTFLKGSTSFFTSTVTATAGFLTAFFLFLFALFFFLYYRRFFVSFVYKLFSFKNHDKVRDTIIKIELVVRSYILGLFTVILIIAVLNTTGLMLLGIQHAVFFGALAAVLTIIPYIGIFIGSLLPIIFALVTKDSLWYPVGVALVFWFVQFLEGNFITPNIVGGRVSINPFAAIVALFIGGMIWGPIGMILSIPVLAMLKVIFDAIDSMKPYGFLLGNPPDEDTLENERTNLKRIISSRKQKAKEKV